jgi:hypothetical protein
MTRRGQRVLSFIIVFGLGLAAPLLAQQATPPATPAGDRPDDRIGQLEKKLDELLRQAADIRQQLDQLKSGQPPTPQPAAEEDLTKVNIVNAPPSSPPPSQTAAQPPAVPPALADVQVVNNVPNPGLSKVFNPDISVIGNFFGHAGSRNPFEGATPAQQLGVDRSYAFLQTGETRAPATLDEAEVAFEAFVDPYAKAKFFLSVTPEGISVEEGYANFVNLPIDVTAKVGKMKATFGKANTWHTHVRPWVDQPLVIHNFFTDDQLADSGISVSKTVPNPFGAFIELTGELFSGNVTDVFARRNQNDLFYNGHLKFFRDFTENSNIEVGTSYARGTIANPLFTAAPSNLNPGPTSEFDGIDVTYRWKPLIKSTYQSFIGRFEGITNRRDDLQQRLFGFYASADYQFAQRWFTGVRIDRADRATPFVGEGTAATDPIFGRRFTDRGASAMLTFWPSEFSQVRGQLRRTNYGGARSVTEFLFQLQFAIGAHGAHSF